MTKMQGENIYLRIATPEDAELIVAWRNAPGVVQNFIYREPISIEGHLKWYEENVLTGKVVQMIICEQGTDAALGSVYIQNIDHQHHHAEEGIFLSEQVPSGKGIGTEAAKLMIQYAFEELGLHKLSARVLAYNTASRKMHEKAGYVQEGYYRDELYIDGKYEDLIFYGIVSQKS